MGFAEQHTAALLVLATYLQRDDAAASGAAACGCFGFLGLVIVATLALNILLLVWVAKDAKNRGMDSPVLWMIVVMVTGIVGFMIYLLVRPQGTLVRCPNCSNRRLPISARCPHCGNASNSPASTF